MSVKRFHLYIAKMMPVNMTADTRTVMYRCESKMTVCKTGRRYSVNTEVRAPLGTTLGRKTSQRNAHLLGRT